MKVINLSTNEVQYCWTDEELKEFFKTELRFLNAGIQNPRNGYSEDDFIVLKIDKDSVEVDGIDTRDYPDFCDAYMCGACWDDGTEFTDVEIELFCDNNETYVYEMIMDEQLYM